MSSYIHRYAQVVIITTATHCLRRVCKSASPWKPRSLKSTRITTQQLTNASQFCFLHKSNIHKIDHHITFNYRRTQMIHNNTFQHAKQLKRRNATMVGNMIKKIHSAKNYLNDQRTVMLQFDLCNLDSVAWMVKRTENSTQVPQLSWKNWSSKTQTWLHGARIRYGFSPLSRATSHCFRRF